MPAIDLRSVRVAHSRFLAAHNAALSTEIERARQQGIVEVHRNPGFTPRTGDLQRATKGRVIRLRNRSVVRLQNPKRYAAAIDKGAKHHVIRARRRKALRFVGSGGVVFRKSVNHPGNKPYHFLSRATETAGRDFGARFKARMQSLARSF